MEGSITVKHMMQSTCIVGEKSWRALEAYYRTEAVYTTEAMCNRHTSLMVLALYSNFK